jgi:hypothetical protein
MVADMMLEDKTTVREGKIDDGAEMWQEMWG